MSKKVYISPSDQTENRYAWGNTNEHVQCQKIAEAEAAALRRSGVEVQVAALGSTMAQRCAESDAWGADIHNCVHTNAANGKVMGTRLFCFAIPGKCETPHLDEETIKARFVAALNAIIESKDNILEDCRLMQATLTDCTGIDTEIESLLEEIDVVTELTKRCIAENSQTAQNQEEYTARYNGFVERYEKAKAQFEQLRTTKAEREAQAEAIGAFMFEVQELDTITEFDEKLWLTIIDTITVHADGRMTFKFQGGKTLTSY